MKTPYRIRKRMNPRDMDSPAMYYPPPCYFSMVSTEMVSEEISHTRDIDDFTYCRNNKRT